MAQMSPQQGPPQLALLERLMAAFNARDMDGLASVFHERVELWPTDEYLPAGTSYHGREGLATMMREGLPALPGVMAHIRAATVFDDRVVTAIRVSLAGEERDSHWVYTFEDGLVIRAEQFPTAAGARAAGKGDALLTGRERQVFQLLAQGLSGPEIAGRLGLSPETVRTHVQNGVSRLGAATRVQAVAQALARGEIAS